MDGQAIETFDDWPARWTRDQPPPPRATFALPSSGDRFRLRYDSGTAAAPDNPFGNNVLAITQDGRARLDHHDRDGAHRAFGGTIDPAALRRILDGLRQARFPAGTPASIRPGAGTRALRVEAADGAAEVELPFHDVDDLPGYREAFQLLDSAIAQLSGGTLRIAQHLVDESVVLDSTSIVP
jgi:hypothetical protein